jgi:hypothetical protein
VRATGAVLLLSVVAACSPGLDHNSRVAPDAMVGQWSCPNGVTVSFARDGTLRVVEDGDEHTGRWAFKGANVFIDLGRRTESWRVAKSNGEPVLFRQWRDADPSADDPYCRRVPDR